LADGAAELGTREHALRQAINLYQGVFCDGIYAEWCLLERERLERRYLRALGQLMSLLIERGEYQEAVDRGRDILQLDPLREEVHRAMMRCFWRMGRRAEGVRQFITCARLLQRELQILPMPETIDLYRGMVEDKIGDLQRADLALNGENLEIQRAFADFLVAAERLSSLLDQVQVPPERSAEAKPVLRA
jgi:DNA-binding SARP family transcriptional activator